MIGEESSLAFSSFLMPLSAVVVILICYFGHKEGVVWPLLSIVAGALILYAWWVNAPQQPSLHLLNAGLGAVSCAISIAGIYLMRFQILYEYDGLRETPEVGRQRLIHGKFIARLACGLLAVCFIGMSCHFLRIGHALPGASYVILSSVTVTSLGLCSVLVATLATSAARRLGIIRLVIAILLGPLYVAIWLWFAPLMSGWRILTTSALAVGVIFCLGASYYQYRRHASHWVEKTALGITTAMAILLTSLVIATLLRSPTLGEQLRRISANLSMLDVRITKKLPSFREKRRAEATSLKAKIQAADDRKAKKELLEELREVAQFLLWADKEEQHCRDLVLQLQRIQGRLLRVREGTQIMTDGALSEGIEHTVEAAEKAAAGITMRVDISVGSGPIERAEVDAKVEELLR